MKWILITLLAVLTWGSGLLAFAGIYTWVDERGVVHIVDSLDKVPEGYRENAKAVNFPEIPTSKNQTKEAPLAEPPRVTFTKTSNETDVYGRKLDWYIAKKRSLLKHIKELKKQIQKNKQAMRLLRRRSLKVYRGTRTEYGIELGQGPIINRWVEYYRLRSINESLKKKLRDFTYMVEKGLIKQAARAYVPDEWLEIISKDP